MQQDTDGRTVTILHRGPYYCVRFLRCNDQPNAVICFEYWVPSPTLDAEFSAEGFFRHRGTNAIGILAAENDWFQRAEMADVLAAIRNATQGFDLIGYGGSMGAYAAIAFSESLGLRSVVAVCPQFSIDAARAPYEARWRGEAARIAASGGFLYDRIDTVGPLHEGWMIYDPGCVDGRHAADIRARHPVGEVRIRHGGHDLMRMLQQADVYTGMLLDMLEGRFDPAAFRRRWRQARRGSAVYWLGVSDALVRRGASTGALGAAKRARGLPHPEPAAIDLAEARARLGLGDAEHARTLAERWAADPAWGDAAQSILAEVAILAELPQVTRPMQAGRGPHSLREKLRRMLRRALG